MIFHLIFSRVFSRVYFQFFTHLLVVTFVVELRRHELGRAKNRKRLGAVVFDCGGKAKVPNAKVARGSIDEDVITLQVAVNHGGILRVEVG